jgi:uncharacterized protein YceK
MPRALFIVVCIVLAIVLLSGCSTLNRYGIGGEPLLYCRRGEAVIDDRLIGPDTARVSVVRRFTDGDALCKV